MTDELEGTTVPKEWCVDWEVEVEITLTKRVKLGASQIIEAGSAEEAIADIKADLETAPDINDLDISSQVEDTDFIIESVDMDTFKTTSEVTAWVY